MNGRWFRDRSVGHAFQEAYRGLLMTGRYAIGFLYLSVPPESIDVNVHPTKAEVRFRENSQIYSFVRSMVKGRLQKESLIPRLQYREQEREPPMPSIFSPRREVSEESMAPWEVRDIPAGPSILPAPLVSQPVPSVPPLPTQSMPPSVSPVFEARASLQVHNAYIVLETPEGMLVIDQHALHERILYEQLRRRIREANSRCSACRFRCQLNCRSIRWRPYSMPKPHSLNSGGMSLTSVATRSCFPATRLY